jgi:hypothetical protein
MSSVFGSSFLTCVLCALSAPTTFSLDRSQYGELRRRLLPNNGNLVQDAPALIRSLRRIGANLRDLCGRHRSGRAAPTIPHVGENSSHLGVVQLPPVGRHTGPRLLARCLDTSGASEDQTYRRRRVVGSNHRRVRDRREAGKLVVRDGRRPIRDLTCLSRIRSNGFSRHFIRGEGHESSNLHLVAAGGRRRRAKRRSVRSHDPSR